MKLLEIQRLFMQAAYDEKVNVGSFLNETEDLSANDCIAIYRGSVRGGLLQAMAEIFPVMKKLLGERSFEGVCRKYIQSYPSRSANVGDYGDRFASFIKTFEPLHDYPYLADVAELEWLYHGVFHDRDDSLLDIQRLSQIPQEQQIELCFRRPFASRLMKTKFPVDLIWESNQSNPAADKTIALEESDHFLLVWRQGYKFKIDRLDKESHYFLSLLNGHRPFEKVVSELLKEYPSANVSELFTQSVSQGWIVDF